jgi:hypothetical protein
MTRERFEEQPSDINMTVSYTESPIYEQAARDIGMEFIITKLPGRNHYYPNGGYRILGRNEALAELRTNGRDLAEFHGRLAQLTQMVGEVVVLRGRLEAESAKTGQ